MLVPVLAVVLSCGIDTLMVAAAIGLSGTAGRVRVALVFAAFEGLMPIAGLLLGKGLAGLIGQAALIAGLVLLVLLGIYMIAFDHDAPVDGNLTGARLLVAGLSVSIDELAVGLSFGLIHFPVALTAALLAAQAFVITLLGMTFGERLRPYLGEAVEKIAGIVLILLAGYLAARQWLFH